MEEFASVLQVINSNRFSCIEEYWCSIPLEATVSNKWLFEDGDSGLYALFHPEFGCIYIGKAISLFRRLKSHYNATLGKETSECWKQFFETINSRITAYWFPLEIKLSNKDLNENLRQALERLLQIKYSPMFDMVYKRGNRRANPDFIQLLSTYRNEHTGR